MYILFVLYFIYLFFVYFYLDDVFKKWVFVFFDWDGCIVIIELKWLVGKEDRKVGSKFKLLFDGRFYEVEIFGFGCKCIINCIVIC